jgi:hypothetical protein
MNDVIDQAAGLSPQVIAAMGAMAAFLLVLAVGVQLSVVGMRRELRLAEEELVDPETGLLPRSALPVRLGAELAWAGTSGTSIGIAALRIRGSRFTHATSVLRRAMREEEQAFLLGEQRVAVELWGAGPTEAAAAVRRLGDELARAGHPVVDAGVALSPRDGRDVEALVASALRDLRPADDPTPPGHDTGRDGRARGALDHATAVLAGVLPWFMGFGVLLLVAWRLLPASIEPLLGDGGSRSAREVLVAAITAFGVPLAAGLLTVAAWNRGGGGAVPRSLPLVRARWSTLLIVAAIVGVPWLVGIVAPEWPNGTGVGFLVSLTVLTLVVATLAHARQLIHAPALVLVLLAVLGAALTWACTDLAQLPLLANAGRLLAAAAVGAVLAQLVERASWLLGLALLAGGIDAWSVGTDSGLTNQLLDASSGSRGGQLAELLLFTGPSVAGHPLLTIGVTDLVFLGLFLAWSHAWRLDMRIVAGLLVASLWVAMTSAVAADADMPVLPFTCAGMVLLLAGRSIVLRRRVRASAE